MALLAVAIGTLCAGALAQQTTIWVEGEAAVSVDGADLAPSGFRPEILSEEQWLTYAAEDANASPDGVTLRYELDARAAGMYAFWARVGFEWVRADLAVRVDGGPWHRMPADHPTTNLVELGVWAELAWDRGPDLELTAGAHTLELHFTCPEGTDRFLFGLDCLALVPREIAWTPEGRLKPGEEYEAEIDRRAAAVVHRLPGAPGAGERIVAPLEGLWQVARYDDPDMDTETYEPVRTLPSSEEYELKWRGIEVPSDAWRARADLSFGHRLVYRTRVDVPADLEGRSFVLHFGGHAWITSVFVNGKFVDSRQATIVPFDVDISRAIEPGTVNVIDVAIKGSYYAIDHAPGELKRNRNHPRTDEFLRYLKWIDCTWPTGKGGGDSIQTGLTRPVELVVAGSAYTSDAFVRCTVDPMRIEADVEVTNPGGADQSLTLEAEAVHDATGEVARRFASQPLTVPAGGVATATISEEWPDAELWWPAESPDDMPTCYRLRTRLLLNGEAVDVCETLFGFRELGVDGRHVTINGVPWRPHAWNSMGFGNHGDLAEYFRWNDRGVRMEGGVNVAFFDRHGIPGRLSMAWEGMFGQVAMDNPRMWENWELHVAQMVRAYRNSPSVLHWSVGNEVMMITGRLFFGGEIGRHEQLLAEVFDVAHRLDPTRTVSEDGAGDAGGLGDSNNWHYVTGEYKIPRQFYEYDIGPASPQREGVDFQTLYRWDGNRPLVQGEEFYYNGMGNMAWFGGPRVYRGKAERDAAGGRYGRMLIEGSRWQDVFQTNPCTGPLPGIETAMAARAVFVREYNAAFAPGSEVTRTIKVFNDTRSDRNLELHWRLEVSGEVADQGTRTYALEAGANVEDALTLRAPNAEGRGQLVLELYDGGERVFADAKPFAVLPPLPPAPLAAGELAVWDPQGRVADWLEAVGQPMTRVGGVEDSPTTTKVVLVGPNAFEEESRSADAQALRAFVAAGNTAIILEQSSPLREGDFAVEGIVVADREKGAAARPEWEKVGGHTGAICHPMAPAHPVLQGLNPEDFFTWAGQDQLNYRLSHATPSRGAIGLVQAGEDLSLAPLFELRSGRGSTLVSQLLIGEKLMQEPVAARLLQNALNWAAARGTAEPARTVVYSAGDEAFASWVGSLGMDLTEVDDPTEALADTVDVAIVRATPAAMQALGDAAEMVRAFANRGGWLMLAGLDEGGLAAFERLTGIAHRLRPFAKEGVLVAAPEDPLAMGISDRDLLQYDPEVIAPWMGLHRVSGKVFSSVVDATDDIASFAQLSAFAEGTDRPLVDGLTSETFWRYTQYVASSGSEPVVLTLDRPETITSIELWQSDAYLWARDIEISLDGVPVRTFTLEDAPGWQTIELPPTRAREISIRLLSCYEPTRDVGPALVTFDEIRVRRAMPDDWGQRVVAITLPAGIVKYPLGAGGIVLNQLRFDGDDLPENIEKKRAVYSALLSNLGCTPRG